MSTERDLKVVQTRLDRRDYKRLRQVADAEDISLKEALRRATMEYVERHGRHDPDDPFFTGVDADGTDESLTAEKTDEYLYGGE